MNQDSTKIESFLVKGFTIFQMIVFSCFSGALCSFGVAQYIYSAIIFVAFLMFSDKDMRYKTLLLTIYLITLIILYNLLGEHRTSMIPYIFMLFSTFLFFVQAFKKGHGQFIIKSLMVTTVLLSVYGITEYIVGKNYIFVNFFREPYKELSLLSTDTKNYQVTLVFEHSLIAAVCLSVMSITLLNIKKKWLCYSLIGLAVLTCFLTGKRTGSLLLILSIGLYFLLKWLFIERKKFKINRKIMFKVMPIFVAVLLLACIPINGNSFLGTTLNRFIDLGGADKMSLIHRGTSIYKGLKQFVSSDILSLLFGHGMYSLTNYYIVNEIPITVEGFYAIDNTYVCFLYDFGLINFALMVYFNYKIIRNAITVIKKHKNNQALIMLVGYLTILFICFIFDALFWYTTVFLIAIFSAYLFSKYEEK